MKSSLLLVVLVFLAAWNALALLALHASRSGRTFWHHLAFVAGGAALVGPQLLVLGTILGLMTFLFHNPGAEALFTAGIALVAGAVALGIVAVLGIAIRRARTSQASADLA